jgi:transcriptional regulator with XRE-family HTH domain
MATGKLDSVLVHVHHAYTMKRNNEFARLEAARAKAGIPIAQLCRRADISHTTFVRLKNGATEHARPETLDNLRAALTALVGEIAA